MSSTTVLTEDRQSGQNGLGAFWRNEGGGRELMRLALPFILSNSIWTLQIVLDRILLSRFSSASVASAMAAVGLFWTPFMLVQNISNYASIFVAQYTGAGRPERVGPVVWQSLYFSVFAGIAFLGFVPIADLLVMIGGHSGELPHLEATYFRCLCFAALPMLLTAASNSFFAGRGDSWTVLLVNAVGLIVNGLLAYGWIFGEWGFPALGIAGAGWATVAGSWCSALVSLGLMLRPRFRTIFQTWDGWRFDAPLIRRLLKFGVPNGIFMACDCLAFTVFLFLIGKQGEIELAATSITFTLNLFAVLPTLGIGQAVEVLVGQRLGEDRPGIAERSTWTGLWLAMGYMAVVCIVYLGMPMMLVQPFESRHDSQNWALIQAFIPSLLQFVAVYTLFDAMNLTFSFALRGAGDTRFVTRAVAVLAWPIMVVPTYFAMRNNWGLYWSWSFASLYIIALAFTFLFRFRQGKWQSMRVIESAVALE